MMNFFITEEGERVFVAEMKDRFGVYLDNFSIKELAKGAKARRQRFINAVLRGGALLFSLADAAEVAGFQGGSADAVRAFLDSIGPHWMPLELSPWRVAEREAEGPVHEACVSKPFMEAYFRERKYDLSLEGSKEIPSPDTFFRLGAVLDWVQENRDRIRTNNVEIDEALRKRWAQLRDDYERDPASLDRELPPVQFDTLRPASFVLTHLLRMLVLEAKAFQFKKHDGLDLCHAVLAAACGSVATLDKHWKRRIENLPRPNCLAKVYCKTDEFVHALEDLVASQ
jgi:hypothetical protein